MPELPVYGSAGSDGHELVTAGTADAVVFGPDGRPQVVIDWKSDVAPSAAALDHYRAQIRAYLEVTGADRGLIVLATSGTVIEVSRAAVA